MPKNSPAFDVITSKNAIALIFGEIFGFCLGCKKNI